MNNKLSITYRDMESSPSLEFVVKEQLEKVERHWPSLQSCRVVIAAPNNKHTHGGHFQVSVDLQVPGSEAFAGRDQPEDHAHEDCHAAIRDAFRMALHELDKDRDRKNKQKRHPRPGA